jgi:hypothetical protein
MDMQDWERATPLHRAASKKWKALAHTAPVHAWYRYSPLKQGALNPGSVFVWRENIQRSYIVTSFRVVPNDTSHFAINISPNLSF